MQENPSNGTSVPVLSIVKNQVTALSTDVAQFFNKVHKNVIRDIENLLVNLPSARRLNFELCFEYSELQNGKALKRYRMTRDGFTLLVMGWTGEKALQFKLAWLDAFRRTQSQKYGSSSSSLLSTWKVYRASYQCGSHAPWTTSMRPISHEGSFYQSA